MHGAVVQLVGEPAALVLLRGDQLIGEAGPFDLSHLRFREQARVLVLARREVREHRGTHDVVAVERTGARQSQRGNLFTMRLERDDDRVLRRRLVRPLARAEHARARVEQLLGLDAGL